MSMNISVPSEWKVLVSLFTNNSQNACHVVNITVRSVSIICCKLWQQFGCHYCTEIQKTALLMCAIYPFKSTNDVHVTVCVILIETTGYDSQLHFYLWSD